MAKIIILSKSISLKNIRFAENEDVFLFGKSDDTITLSVPELIKISSCNLHLEQMDTDPLLTGITIGKIMSKFEDKVEIISETINKKVPVDNNSGSVASKRRSLKKNVAKYVPLETKQKEDVSGPELEIKENVTEKKKPSRTRKQKKNESVKENIPAVLPAKESRKKAEKEKNVAATKSGSAFKRTFAKSVSEVKELLAVNGFSDKYAEAIFEVMKNASDVTLEMLIRMELAKIGVEASDCEVIARKVSQKYL